MRKGSPLRAVCRRLTDHLRSRQGITEDQVLSLMDELAAEEPKDLPDMPEEYRKMSFMLGEAWRYREWKKLSSEQAFFYGGLWGSVRSFECRYQKIRDEDRMKMLIPKYKDKDWLFQAIESRPGILHKELAQKGKISASRLTQIMDDEDIDYLISHRLSGRQKYYFLKPQGEELLGKLKSTNKKVLGSYTEPRKAISINNGSTEYVYDKVISGLDVGSGISLGVPDIMNYRRGEEIFNMVSYEWPVKTIVGVNEWIQKLHYTNQRKDSLLQNGLEMFSGS